MTTFLLYNIGREWLSIGMRLKEEGYPIYYYNNREEQDGSFVPSDVGVGIFKKNEIITNVNEVLVKFFDKKDELIILIDDNENGWHADLLRLEGWKVVGGSSYCDEIEYERDKGLDLMEQVGLDLPFEETFTSINDAIIFVENDDEDMRYVFKPNGENMAGSNRTYTSKNKQDLISYLKWTKSDMEQNHTEIKKFVLQEFIEGIEADFTMYFNGDHFLENVIILDIEEKKSGDGNKGEAVGCMGNIVVSIKKSKFKKYFKNLESYFREARYVGSVSINNIFSAKTQGKYKKYKEGMPYALEFTPRFGWDCHTAEMAILKYDRKKIGEFYEALANQGEFDFPTEKVSCGIRVYSGSIATKKEGIGGKLFSFDKNIGRNLWFNFVSYKKNECVIEDNPVLVINTVGKNLKNTISDCYNILENKVTIPDAYYRNEIGQRAEKVLRFLRKYNWI